MQVANAAASSRHSNVTPASVPENVKAAVAVLIAPVGPVLIVVSGAAVSTVNVRVAGVASTLPGGVAGADLERVRAVGEVA